MKKTIIFLLTIFSLSATAQIDQCFHLPDTFLQEYIEVEKEATRNMAEALAKSNTEYNIPVVVHVLHEGEDYGVGSHITTEQVESAIIALNGNFNNQTAGADVGFTFCLAQQDPEGNPTNGINYIYGCDFEDYCTNGIDVIGYTSVGASEIGIKNATVWDNALYYNIWVVSSIGGGTGIIGYAYFPIGNNYDGTVLLATSFGTIGSVWSWYNQSHVAAHEIGHGMGLYHIHEGNSCASESNCLIQGDRVCDTPPQPQGPGCLPPCVGSVHDENLMGYGPQTCRLKFTEGQATRMRSYMLGTERITLASSTKCEPVEILCTNDQPINLSTTISASGVTLEWESNSTDCRIQGQHVLSQHMRGYDAFSPFTVSNTDLPFAGTYQWRVRCKCDGEYGPWSAIQSFDWNSAQPSAMYDMNGQPIAVPVEGGITIHQNSYGTHKTWK